MSRSPGGAQASTKEELELVDLVYMFRLMDEPGRAKFLLMAKHISNAKFDDFLKSLHHP